MQRNWIFVSVPVVAAIVLDDQLTKAAATQAGLVAHNPSYALGVVGGPAHAATEGPGEECPACGVHGQQVPGGTGVRIGKPRHSGVAAVEWQAEHPPSSNQQL